MIRFELSPDIYRAENHFYRDIARKLSTVRDLTAMIETLESLIDGDLKEKIKTTIVNLINQLLIERDSHIQAQKDNLVELSQRLGEHRVITTGMPWSKHTKRSLLKSLHQGYRQALNCQQICQKDPSSENVHKWRQRSKYLRYQLVIIQNCWTPVFRVWANEMHCLTDLLGQSNNLAVLHQYLEQSLSPTKKRQEIIDLIKVKQIELVKSAQEVGIKLYAENAKNYKMRMGIYLSEWPALH